MPSRQSEICRRAAAWAATWTSRTTQVFAQCVTPRGAADFAPVFAVDTDRRVSKTWGNEIFMYGAVQDAANRQVSAWMFRAFGGLKVPDGETECSQWVVTTSVR